ncbi:MAG: YdcF family protein [Chlorobiaceae bacterium]
MRVVEGEQRRTSVSKILKADAVVVLSGMLRNVDGAPLGEWNDAADRFDGGIELIKSGKAPVIVFTRGQLPWEPDKIPEGELLSKRAILLGVPQKMIRLTGVVGNTAEEAVATWRLLGFKKGDLKSIILVTSAYHMPRALLLFERVGFKVVPFRVDYQTGDTSELKVLSYLPNGGSLEESERALREMIGWLYYWGTFNHSIDKL